MWFHARPAACWQPDGRGKHPNDGVFRSDRSVAWALDDRRPVTPDYVDRPLELPLDVWADLDIYGPAVVDSGRRSHLNRFRPGRPA